MLVKDFLLVANDSSYIHVEKDEYEYTFHGFFNKQWELKKCVGSIKANKNKWRRKR